MPTKFALERLDVAMPGGKIFTFWFDGNGKITGYVNGTAGSFDNPIANAFSLVQVQDCPFATPTCKSVCYVHKLEKAEEGVHQKYRHNSLIIREVIKDYNYFHVAASAFAEWIKTHCNEGFRWHVSGDIFSIRYAGFIRRVCDLASNVPFVIYTRSFSYLLPLVGCKNLVVNLSADKDNWQEALNMHDIYGFRLCYLTVQGDVPPELPKGSVLFPSHELRGRDLADPTQASWWQLLTKEQRQMVCPPDFFGQSEHFRCGVCKKCF